MSSSEESSDSSASSRVNEQEEVEDVPNVDRSGEVQNVESTNILQDDVNDEKYQVSDARDVATPEESASEARPARLGSGSPESNATPPDHQILADNPMDEREAVHNALNIPTPRQERPPEQQVGNLVQNAPHDEVITVDQQSSDVSTPDSERHEPRDAHQQQQQYQPPPAPQQRQEYGQDNSLSPGDDDADGSDNDDEEYRAHGYANQKPDALDSSPGAEATAMPNREYNPANYAKVNATASREMQDLFKHINDYQPAAAELPAKLRPFIPDYIPCIGDLEPFCKIPRPDNKPDGLGLYVVDEPTIPQSNPAVVLLELRAVNVHGSEANVEVVDSFENAANRPEVIDRWIADVKKVHYKKPLPTVNYKSPMPDIESLLQIWPQEFEDVLNFNFQFPPPQIDLGIDQYVRMLCAILDVPTHESLIDSLHVVFTLYQEFRSNQHFQHE